MDRENSEKLEKFLEGLPEFLKQKFGADAEMVVMSKHTTPAAVRDGFTGRIRWEIRLMHDRYTVHQVLIEMPKYLHPRVGTRVSAVLERFADANNIHICSEGPAEWHRTLHLFLHQNQPCEEVATAVAALIDGCRISRVGYWWLLVRRWLAARILPDGVEIS